MKTVEATTKVFRSKPGRNCAKYEGKTVEFLYDLDGRLLLLTGKFVVHVTPEFESVHIRYAGRLDRHDPPCSDYLFQLSGEHLRSTFPATRPGSQVDFLMEQPLVAPDCVTVQFREQALSKAIH